MILHDLLLLTLVVAVSMTAGRLGCRWELQRMIREDIPPGATIEDEYRIHPAGENQ